MVIWTSLQACGVVLPFAISTSICRSSVTICSGLYLLIDMTGLPPQVNSLSFHLVQKSPVRSSECACKTAKQKIGEEKPKRQEVEFCGKSQGRFALCATYTGSTTWSRNRTDGPCSPAKGTSF